MASRKLERRHLPAGVDPGGQSNAKHAMFDSKSGILPAPSAT